MKMRDDMSVLLDELEGLVAKLRKLTRAEGPVTPASLMKGLPAHHAPHCHDVDYDIMLSREGLRNCSEFSKVFARLRTDNPHDSRIRFLSPLSEVLFHAPGRHRMSTSSLSALMYSPGILSVRAVPREISIDDLIPQSSLRPDAPTRAATDSRPRVRISLPTSIRAADEVPNDGLDLHAAEDGQSHQEPVNSPLVKMVEALRGPQAGVTQSIQSRLGRKRRQVEGDGRTWSETVKAELDVAYYGIVARAAVLMATLASGGRVNGRDLPKDILIMLLRECRIHNLVEDAADYIGKAQAAQLKKAFPALGEFPLGTVLASMWWAGLHGGDEGWKRSCIFFGVLGGLRSTGDGRLRPSGKAGDIFMVRQYVRDINRVVGHLRKSGWSGLSVRREAFPRLLIMAQHRFINGIEAVEGWDDGVATMDMAELVRRTTAEPVDVPRLQPQVEAA